MSLLLAAPTPTLDSIATPTLWWVTIGAVVVLLVLDFLLTRRPHDVSMKEALAWSAFYVALPLAFAAGVYRSVPAASTVGGAAKSASLLVVTTNVSV